MTYGADGQQLYPYQQDGVTALLAHLGRNPSKAALLADPVGGGKTPQAVHVALGLGAARILVVCPASLRINWQRELVRWSGGRYRPHVLFSGDDTPASDVVICSYDLATREPPQRALTAGPRWDLVVYDESHFLKSVSSNRTRACMVPLWNHADHRLLISGTPLPNGRAVEAWPTFMRLCPELFGDWKAFKDRYCVEVKDPHSGRLSYPRSKNLDELGRLARERFMVKRSRTEVMADLPPLVRSTVYLDVPELREPHPSPELADLTDPGLIERIIAAVNAGQSIQGALPADTDAISTARRKLGDLKVRPALEFLLEQVETTPRMVVFCHHREVWSRLLDGLLNASGVDEVWAVRGGTPPDERQQAVDNFQALKDTDRTAVFLASITAASTGLTLTAADTVVFVESDWLPANLEQAEGRVLRKTQDAPLCRAIYLVVPDTLDEHVQRAVVRKQRDIRKVFPDMPGGAVREEQEYARVSAE